MDNNFLEYNALDAACTQQVQEAIWPELEPGGFSPAYQMTIDLLPVLTYMQTKGIKISLAELEVTKQDILRSIHEKQEELNKIVGREINVNSSKEMQTYFYVELSIPPYYNEGSVTVDDSALQKLARGTVKRPGLRQAKLVQEIRGLQKLYGTYLNIEFDKDERLRCSYNPRGTKFGRLSSSKTVFGTGTNQQNLPQEFKRFLIADDDYILVEFDKRQAEWVCVAYLSGDANMLKAIEEGQDVHIHTASMMFGLEKEVIEYESKLVGMHSDPEIISELRNSDSILSRFAAVMPRTMSCRQCGKKSNHGLNYDETYVMFALINEIDQRESKRVVELYHSGYLGIRKWHESIKRQLQKDRSLTNCFGRKVKFLDQWGPDLWKSAYSMLPQSTVVDSLNQGMVKTYDDKAICSTSGWNIDILAQVHDSMLTQIPIKLILQGLVSIYGTYHFEDIYNSINNYLSPNLHYSGRTFKIATDMKIGKNWGGYNKQTNPLGMREVKDLSLLPAILGELNGSGT